MLYLRDAAEEYGLRNVIGQALQYPQVQGVVLKLDPFWFRLWLAREDGSLSQLERRLENFWMHSLDRGLYPSMPPEIFGNVGLLDDARHTLRSAPDLWWSSRTWQQYASFQGFDGKAPPIIVKVCTTPMAEALTIEKLESRLRIIVEPRGTAYMSNAGQSARPIVGGVSIGDSSGSRGTLGGVLHHPSGARFATTCSHVFPEGGPAYQPANVDTRSSPPIGSIVYRTPLVPVNSPTMCNPYARTPRTASADIALVQLQPAIASLGDVHKIGPITTAAEASSVYQTLQVEFTGSTSGYRCLTVGALAVTYRFVGPGQAWYCLSDLFEVTWPRWFRTELGRPVNGGDSGAWVCAEGEHGTAWCGSIIGQDRARGFAAFAEFQLKELSAAGYDIAMR